MTQTQVDTAVAAPESVAASTDDELTSAYNESNGTAQTGGGGSG